MILERSGTVENVSGLISAIWLELSCSLYYFKTISLCGYASLSETYYCMVNEEGVGTK